MQVTKPASEIRTMPDDGDIESFMRQHSGPKGIRQQQKEAKKRRNKAVKQIMKTEERMLLKYLYMEGYADSYEEAEYLLEELDDEVFYENVSTGNARRASFGNISQRVTASQAAEIRASARRRPEPEPEPRAPKAPKGPTTVPSRGVSANEPALRRRTPEGHRKRGSSPAQTAEKQAKLLATGHSGSTGRYSRTPTPETKERAKRIRAALRNRKNWGTKAEEYVLEYLVQEGYANSYKNADVILELMSEEWFEQILND